MIRDLINLIALNQTVIRNRIIVISSCVLGLALASGLVDKLDKTPSNLVIYEIDEKGEKNE